MFKYVFLSIYWVLGTIVFATSAGAAVYRCRTPGGPVRYSDHSCGENAVRMNLDKAPLTESHATHANKRIQPNSKKPSASGVHVNFNNTVKNSPNTGATPIPTRQLSRGLPLSTFNRLSTGMSVGQVLAIAGPPDYRRVVAANTDAGIFQNAYYYQSTGYNNFVTRIRFVNGRVVKLERTPVLP